MSVTTFAQASGQLRSKMEGMILDNRFKLPELERVRVDAAEAINLMQSPLPPQIEGRTPEGELVPVGVLYTLKFPDLFKFSLFCEVKDEMLAVPTGILSQCVWALEWTIRGLMEASEYQFQKTWNVPFNKTRYVFLENARWKAAAHLLKPEINRPLDALRHLSASVQDCQKIIGGTAVDVWYRNPNLFFHHAIALARSRADDAKAKEGLSRIVRDKGIDEGPNGVLFLIVGKIYLSRVLGRLGEDAEAQKHKDPILTGLGGEKWLVNRRQSIKTVLRGTRTCRNCQAREPLIKLFQCSRCKYTLYCSKKCQLANYQYHKEDAASLKEIANMEPGKARRAEDWRTWRAAPVPANSVCLVHALGLQRDPSRSRTHIVFKDVEYVPHSKKMMDRFKVVRVGVFKVDDIWTYLEAFLSLKSGEGKKLVKEALDEFDPGATRNKNELPILDLMFSSDPGFDREVYFRTYSMSQENINRLPYDANWRNSLNSGEELVRYRALKIQKRSSEESAWEPDSSFDYIDLFIDVIITGRSELLNQRLGKRRRTDFRRGGGGRSGRALLVGK
ncbi:hypothetical protein BT96DRAFT_937926 [Gymnopus androsaceus JB14]|uniref:MYND-type domain-containing protein n=1 Tax=Gymnopus androsaceus JB14 TaxID=1447944 RepID=A0A6A4HU82_9AGAR|nr:hypothetical protein BT96DRAFT_937926 [Gymnopus androsaceus JB14]